MCTGERVRRRLYLYQGDREEAISQEGSIVPQILGELRGIRAEGLGHGCHKSLLDLVFLLSPSWRKDSVTHLHTELYNYPLFPWRVEQ